MYFARILILFFIGSYSFDSYCQKQPSKNLIKQTVQNNSGAADIEYVISDFIKIDPNPFDDFINVEILEVGNGSVEIIILSIVGKVVRNFTFPANNRYILNLSDLEKGIYLLKINNGKSACVKRIIHQ